MIKLSSHMANCIAQFMTNFEQTMHGDIKAVPCETCVLRSNLIKEEAKEYAESLIRTDDELDAIVDLLYVNIGTNLACGVPVEPVNSGQIYVPNLLKQAVYSQVKTLTDELDSRFPCFNRTFAATNALTIRLLDIATMVGYDLRGAFDAVHKANMGKLWKEDELCRLTDCTIKKKPDGYLVRRADGKVIKPPSFVAADLTSFLPASIRALRH